MSLREARLIGKRSNLSDDLVFYSLRAKRAFDIVAAATGLLLLSPLVLVVSVAIKLNSRGPVFVRETVYGRKNAIHVLKFRSVTACVKGNCVNENMTQVGRVLQRTGVDQLPQLINVLRGDMSIVGPTPSTRPGHPYSHDLFPMLDGVKPGMTRGVQQTKNRQRFDTMEQSIDDDLRYLKNWSLFDDIKIILAAVISER
jgi:lipopolysaccharide/colanic/teichoic acid biosynthesis glycosyltransferase